MVTFLDRATERLAPIRAAHQARVAQTFLSVPNLFDVTDQAPTEMSVPPEVTA